MEHESIVWNPGRASEGYEKVDWAARYSPVLNAIRDEYPRRIAREHASIENSVHLLPKEIDDEVARVELDAVGVWVDALTAEQDLLAGWRE